MLQFLGVAPSGQVGFVAHSRMASLALFAYLLTLAPSDAAGRAYAAYGGVYIASSLLWLWIIEGQRPDRWDFTGAAICVVGPAIVLFGPRTR